MLPRPQQMHHCIAISRLRDTDRGSHATSYVLGLNYAGAYCIQGQFNGQEVWWINVDTWLFLDWFDAYHHRQGKGPIDSHGLSGVLCLKQMPRKGNTRLRHGRHSGVRWLGSRYWSCHSEGIIRNG